MEATGRPNGYRRNRPVDKCPFLCGPGLLKERARPCPNDLMSFIGIDIGVCAFIAHEAAQQCAGIRKGKVPGQFNFPQIPGLGGDETVICWWILSFHCCSGVLTATQDQHGNVDFGRVHCGVLRIQRWPLAWPPTLVHH